MSIIIAMCLYALAMSISPGPVNLMVLASGVNHGVRHTMPFVLGAVIGFTLLLLVVGLGLGVVTAEHSVWLTTLCLTGNSFIFYLGAKLFSASVNVHQSEHLLPTFAQGMLLQWLNPKAWIASVAGVSAFNLIDAAEQLLVFVTLYFVICLFAMSSWALVGDKVSVYLNNQRRMLTFNRLMGSVLMLLALYLMTSFLLEGYS
ncbi:hypothetical protein tinsulaeT_20070 [Thalassotalea insulae]|uniref:LysE family translocator n=1 Tax=Thalassotalea insulae TaxID=2056778 RepID=A0ABQ6GTI5_9GAMM|nr:LysE family translocator [Thalassotalea insulae]GLX78667.1 hypothetical protein tinsulaeT_20070 [Thalassotalea insulae]